jgi:ABC-type dipeptide/oligopeptide/nickel transport system permease component
LLILIVNTLVGLIAALLDPRLRETGALARGVA